MDEWSVGAQFIGRLRGVASKVFQDARLPIGAQLQPIKGGKGSFIQSSVKPLSFMEGIQASPRRGRDGKRTCP